MLRTASLAAVVIVAAASAYADAPAFVSALSDSDAKASGITHLSAAQKSALDKLASRDITLAREGGVTAFAGSFVTRRSDEEKKAAGIDTLSKTERDNLDALVARAIEYHPMTFQGQAVATTPAPAVAAAAAAQPQTWSLPPQKWEVHGDATMTVGGGSHGSSFYGAGFDVYATDPSGKFTIGFGVDEYHVKGWMPPCLLTP